MDKKKFQGIIVPLINPCDDKDNLDQDALLRHYEHMSACDLRGYYINGGTGDAFNLTQEERLAIAELLVPAIKKDNKTAIVHVGQTDMREALVLAEQACSLGADAVASIPPAKDFPEIEKYYRALAESGLPVIVYVIPKLTGIQMGMAEIRRLLNIPAVAGCKISDWHVFLIRQISNEFPEKIVYSGFDELLLPGLLYGADGAIGTFINLFPNFYLKVYEAVQDEKIDKVRNLCEAFSDFLALAWKNGVFNSFEEIIYRRGIAKRCFRQPSSWVPGTLPEEIIAELLERQERIEHSARQLVL